MSRPVALQGRLQWLASPGSPPPPAPRADSPAPLSRQPASQPRTSSTTPAPTDPGLRCPRASCMCAFLPRGGGATLAERNISRGVGGLAGEDLRQVLGGRCRPVQAWSGSCIRAVAVCCSGSGPSSAASLESPGRRSPSGVYEGPSLRRASSPRRPWRAMVVMDAYRATWLTVLVSASRRSLMKVRRTSRRRAIQGAGAEACAAPIVAAETDLAGVQGIVGEGEADDLASAEPHPGPRRRGGGVADRGRRDPCDKPRRGSIRGVSPRREAREAACGGEDLGSPRARSGVVGGCHADPAAAAAWRRPPDKEPRVRAAAWSWAHRRRGAKQARPTARETNFPKRFLPSRRN